MVACFVELLFSLYQKYGKWPWGIQRLFEVKRYFGLGWTIFFGKNFWGGGRGWAGNSSNGTNGIGILTPACDFETGLSEWARIRTLPPLFGLTLSESGPDSDSSPRFSARSIQIKPEILLFRQFSARSNKSLIPPFPSTYPRSRDIISFAESGFRVTVFLACHAGIGHVPLADCFCSIVILMKNYFYLLRYPGAFTFIRL